MRLEKDSGTRILSQTSRKVQFFLPPFVSFFLLAQLTHADPNWYYSLWYHRLVKYEYSFMSIKLFNYA